MRHDFAKEVRFFSALADETRLKILSSLLDSPKTVSEIYSEFDGKLTLSAISHQLRLLSDADILVFRKDGRNKLFGLSDKHCWCVLRDARYSKDTTSCKACSKINYKVEK